MSNEENVFSVFRASKSSQILGAPFQVFLQAQCVSVFFIFYCLSVRQRWLLAERHNPTNTTAIKTLWSRPGTWSCQLSGIVVWRYGLRPGEIAWVSNAWLGPGPGPDFGSDFPLKQWWVRQTVALTKLTHRPTGVELLICLKTLQNHLAILPCNLQCHHCRCYFGVFCIVLCM